MGEVYTDEERKTKSAYYGTYMWIGGIQVVDQWHTVALLKQFP